MLIVISTEYTNPRETHWIPKLLDAGANLFHIRKPTYSEKELSAYIDAIPVSYREHIVLHTHHRIGVDFGIHRYHITEKVRLSENLAYQKMSHCTWSTSVHDINTFNGLDTHWSYAFLSPVFSSISKKGYGNIQNGILNSISKRTNSSVKLIGLGGVTPQNKATVYAQGADGIALLGSVWQHDNPVEIIRQCKK